ncbi:MAG: hypothetical protein AAF657_04740 [Acidobacteriota bacterium]
MKKRQKKLELRRETLKLEELEKRVVGGHQSHPDDDYTYIDDATLCHLCLD